MKAHLQGQKMNDIKTSDKYKSGIKTKEAYIDPGFRMKQAYIKTRNLADKQINSKDTSANEYASEEYTEFAGQSLDRAFHTVNRQGQKAFKETAENMQKAKFDYVKSKTEQKIHKAEHERQKSEYNILREENYEVSSSSSRKSSSSGSGKSEKTVPPSPLLNARNSATNPEAIKKSRQGANNSGRNLYIQKQRIKKAEETVKNTAKKAAKAAQSLAASVKAAVSAIVAGGWVSVLILIIIILFGAVLAVFTSSGGASSPVSEEVNAYTSLIQIYAQKHGIPEYVDLIKAIQPNA